MIRYETGDLLDADLPAIAHGCNTQGVMGSGIARTIRARFPVMFDIYKTLCDEGYFYLGGLFPYTHDDDYKIFNLGTQILPGPNADLIAIAVSVRRMLWLSADDGTEQIGIPRIGAGIGGLDWGDVEHALQIAAHGSAVDLIVYTLPEEQEKFGGG